MSCFVDCIRKEGFLSLYRGLAAPMFGQFLQGALIFAGESVALRYLEPDMKFQSEMSTETVMNVFLAGSFGGLLQCLVLVPADLIKCKLQVDMANGKRAYGGNMDCINQVYRSEGIAGLYKGFGVTALREVPAFGVYFFVYRYTLALMSSTKSRSTVATIPAVKDSAALQPLSLSSSVLYDTSAVVDDMFVSSASNARTTPPADTVDNEGPGLSTLVAGGLAGCASWLLIYPVDVIKSHVQTGSSSASQVAVDLYRRHGVSVFTRGLGVTMLRAFPVNAAVFYALETLKMKMGIR